MDSRSKAQCLCDREIEGSEQEEGQKILRKPTAYNSAVDHGQPCPVIFVELCSVWDSRKQAWRSVLFWKRLMTWVKGRSAGASGLNPLQEVIAVHWLKYPALLLVGTARSSCRKVAPSYWEWRTSKQLGADWTDVSSQRAIFGQCAPTVAWEPEVTSRLPEDAGRTLEPLTGAGRGFQILTCSWDVLRLFKTARPQWRNLGQTLFDFLSQTRNSRSASTKLMTNRSAMLQSLTKPCDLSPGWRDVGEDLAHSLQEIM